MIRVRVAYHHNKFAESGGHRVGGQWVVAAGFFVLKPLRRNFWNKQMCSHGITRSPDLLE